MSVEMLVSDFDYHVGISVATVNQMRPEPSSSMGGAEPSRYHGEYVPNYD